MREIKFRAWDRDCRRWLQDDEWALLPNGKVMIYDEADSVFVEADEGHFQVVEYIDRKDKNGVEICEGDFLSPAKHLSEYGPQLVIWDKETAGFTTPGGLQFDELDEVIGNRFEHPELLEAAGTPKS